MVLPNSGLLVAASALTGWFESAPALVTEMQCFITTGRTVQFSVFLKTLRRRYEELASIRLLCSHAPGTRRQHCCVGTDQPRNTNRRRSRRAGSACSECYGQDHSTGNQRQPRRGHQL